MGRWEYYALSLAMQKIARGKRFLLCLVPSWFLVRSKGRYVGEGKVRAPSAAFEEWVNVDCVEKRRNRNGEEDVEGERNEISAGKAKATQVPEEKKLGGVARAKDEVEEEMVE